MTAAFDAPAVETDERVDPIRIVAIPTLAMVLLLFWAAVALLILRHL